MISNEIADLSERRAAYTDVLHKSLEIFVSHTEEAVDDVMSNGLRPIADAAGLDRIIIFRILERENKTFGEIYRWDKLTGGTAPLDPALQVLPATTAITRWISIMINNVCISLRRSEFAEDEAAFLSPRGVQSILIVPVFVEREFWGVVTFHDNTNERDFDEDCTGLLRSTARLCASTLIRDEKTKSVDRAIEELKRREKITDILNKAAILFLSHSDKPFDEMMTAGISPIVDLVNLDRFSIFRNFNMPDGLHTSQIYRWDRVSGGTTQPNSYFTDITFAQLAPNWANLFAGGKAVNGPVRLISEHVGTLLKKIGVLSVFFTPVFINDAFWGFALYEDHHSERSFDDEYAELMRSATFLCANTVIRSEMEREITEAEVLKQAREADERVREADERTQIIFDTAPVGCSMFDKNFNILDCNHEIVRRFELPDKQVFLEKFFALSPEYQPCGRKSSDMAFEQNSKAFSEGYNRFEWMHQTLGGEPLPCEITQVRVKYRDECVVAAYNRDLREQKALQDEIDKENERYKIMVKQQAEAEAASNAKSSFLSSMSHEMRTPMNAIIGMTEIGINTTDMDRKNYALNKIKDASRHLLGVINEVLEMSKIEANKLELTHISFDLKRSLYKAVSLVQFTIDDKHLLFSVNMSDNMPSLFIGDDQRLTQVITNLLSNAVKFTPKEGSINLEVLFMGEENGICELRFEVADTGIGISPEQQEKIFNAFEQADSGTTRKFGGTGLGLVITKRIVELMGGRIWVESELGRGARFIFIIKLPHDEQGSSPQNGFEKADVSIKDIYGKTNGKKMLLVEDIEINREILIALLEGTGLIIDTAENGKIALDMVRADPAQYDILFMDVQMPEMDGYEATRQIRALPRGQDKKLPIIAMTANVFQEDIEKCHAAGMDDHIGKPLDLATVLEKLRTYLT